jgi:hypothetical protein
MAKWIKRAIKKPGAFCAQAKRAGKSTAAFARSVLKKGSEASTLLKRRACLTQTLARMRARRYK